MKGLFHIVWMLLAACSLQAQAPLRQQWVDSVLAGMNVDQKLGQLFVIRSYAGNANEHSENNLKLIRDYHIGGVCFFKGSTARLVELNNLYQSCATVPLLMSIDGEWGLGMRMTDGFSFPKQMTLGAIDDNRLIYRLGREIAGQLKAVGIQLNFAPVLDINNNPENPVIHERSFGSGRKNVVAKSFAYMQGLQDGGVMSCLKHFPGHGDTDTDSHYELPSLSHDRRRLDSVELFPFQALIGFQPSSVMVGHLHIPALDSTANIPATLSKNAVTGILRRHYRYDGLVITDALEMKGVTRHFSSGDIALKAFQAGNDILLLSENIPESIQRLKQALDSSEISMAEVDEKVRRILKAKFDQGLYAFPSISQDSLARMKSWRQSEALKEELYRKAFTLVRDPKSLVPIRDIPKRIVCLSLGAEINNPFQKRLLDYADLQSFSLFKTEDLQDSIRLAIESADLVLVSVHQLNYQVRKNYGLNIELVEALNELIEHKPCIVTLFGCPYTGIYFPKRASIFLAYEDNGLSLDVAAQMIFGTDPIIGRCPVSLGDLLQEGKGIRRPSLMRMGYSVPEYRGMDRDKLLMLDSLAAELIRTQAAPGCQVVVAKNQSIVFRKSYGYTTYDSSRAIDHRSMYDLASLTKILCTAPVMMQLEDQGRIQVRKKFSDYLPEFKQSNKADLSLKDFMLHQGRLAPWIPFYKSTLLFPDSLNAIRPEYYDTLPSINYLIPVCDRFYLRSDYDDTIFARILESKRPDEKKYVYSDLGFYFIPKLVRKLSDMGLEAYFNRYFAKPLGLRNTAFNPRFKPYPLDQLVPSEEDQYFRHQRVQGYVHDMGAAMLGGISGHAGLFSNATEVAQIMQLFLNRGNWGGKELIPNTIIRQYTERDKEFGRRALLFDLPESIPTETAYVSKLASPGTFGHQGFTGTCAWADPENQLVFVFLSNRTYPNSKINLLHRNRYRMKMQDVLYQSLLPVPSSNSLIAHP
ncbi:MAG TPA: glycoside hydrolase family 3 N-terminal domain-containing protein [Saprospiraceae bacterium]|nr:glycoside hydrolase family 3 N-terminal domain-containing protein [Saprospiraceae bacterium]